MRESGNSRAAAEPAEAMAARVRASFERQAMMATLGVRLTAVERGRVELVVDHDDRFTQQHGFLHAGAVTAVLDSACGYAAFSMMAPDAAVLTAAFTVNLLAPAAGRQFVMTGEVIRAGRTLVVCRGEAVADGAGAPFAVMQATLSAVYDRPGIAHLPDRTAERAHTVAMAAWKDVEQAEPGFAARVRQLFEAGRHKTIATLRADGSPRISGIECEFADGELRFGSMPGARKGADLRRDPRFALHGPVFHPQEGKEAEWPGEAKIAGRAVLAGPAGEESAGDLFAADVREVVITRLNPEATLLVIESWTPRRGLRVVERE